MQLDKILDRLSRVTASQKFIPEIDGLRFIAITTVVLFHLRTNVLRVFNLNHKSYRGEFLFDLLSNGGLGVNLFFTISGFILALPFAQQYLNQGRAVNLRSYYVRRLTRLEPPYIIIMTIFLALQVAATTATLAEAIPHYLASLGYVHFFVFGTWSTINPVAWSLETEVQFYIIAPLIALIFLVKSGRLRAMVLTLTILFSSLSSTHYFNLLESLNLHKSIAVYLAYFLLGFLLASLYLTWEKRMTKSYFWDALALLSLVILYGYSEVHIWYWELLILVCIVVIFAGVFFGRMFNKFFTLKIVTVIGGMCYSIYLIHYVFLYLVMLFVAPAFSEIDNFYSLFALSALIVLPSLLIVSSITFYFLEKPFMYKNWYRNFKQAFQQPEGNSRAL